MRLVMLGPPGAGKGTQAVMLAKKMEIPHISTGDIFRAAIKKGTPLGKKAREYMDAGNLVPDEITVGIVRERLARPDCQKGFVLDGFPRTLPQAESLDEILDDLDMPLNYVIDLEVSAEEVILRLENRRSCPQCGKVYHLIFNPPAQDTLCDDCKVKLIHRDDDTREVIENRIRVYHEKTDPLVNYYSRVGILEKFNGEKPIEKIIEEIVEFLKRNGSFNKES